MSQEQQADPFRVPMALGDLAARVKMVEERLNHSDQSSHGVVSQFREEIRQNTTKFDTIISSLQTLIKEHRKDVDEKIEEALEKLESSNRDRYVNKLELAIIEKKIDGLTAKLTLIWTVILLAAAAIQWLAAHPNFLQVIK